MRKFVLGALLTLLLSAQALAAPVFVWQRNVADTTGLVVASASVAVRDSVTNNLAQLYSDVDGLSGTSNPTTADSSGFVRFYVAEGRYNITATSGGFSRTWSNERLGVDSSELKYERTAAEIAASVTPTDYAYPPGQFERYGANGDDTTADTSALANAGLSSNRPFGQQGKTYYVAHTSTLTINTVAYRYAVNIPTGVVYDLRGSTVKLANSQNTSVFVSSGTSGSGIVNGTIDGNLANQTTPATGEMAGVLFYDTDDSIVDGLTVIDARQYSGRFLDMRRARLTNLKAIASYGDCWSFGTSGSITFELADSFIDNAYAEDCQGTYAGLEGNAALVTAFRTTIGTLQAKDAHGGFKIQNSSAHVTVGALLFDGDDQTYGSANCGTKVQGTSGSSLYPIDINIGEIVTRNCYGNGLVVNDVDSVSIGSYMGYNNGSGSGAAGSDQNDVELNTSDGTGLQTVRIDQIMIDNPDAAGIRHQGDGTALLGSVTVRNPTGTAVQDTGSGRFYLNDLLAIDDQGGAATMTYALHVTGTSKGRIGTVTTNLTHSTAQPRVLIAAAGNYDLVIGEVRLGSTDVLGGVVQLTNGATSTAVTAGHIFRAYVGGTADYFHPIIMVEPWDTSAKALSGRFGYTVTDGSSGTGFTITHPTAGASDFVIWRVVAWKVLSQPSSAVIDLPSYLEQAANDAFYALAA